VGVRRTNGGRKRVSEGLEDATDLSRWPGVGPVHAREAGELDRR